VCFGACVREFVVVGGCKFEIFGGGGHMRTEHKACDQYNSED